MKKLFLLAASVSLSMGVMAQSAGKFGNHQVGKPASSPKFIDKTTSAQKFNRSISNTGKSTGPNDRWYSHLYIVDTLNFGTLSASAFPIWFDSMVRVNYTSGPSSINFAAAGQVIDPSHYTLMNDPVLFPGEMNIGLTQSYTVDSIYFAGAYLKNPSRPVGIFDTLVFSVAPQQGYYYWVEPPATNGVTWAEPYLPNPGMNGDTLKLPGQMDPDSVRRIDTMPGYITWKVPVGDADRQQDSSGYFFWTDFAYPLPAPMVIPAGRNVSMTVAFKTGDQVMNPNVDSVNMYHRLYIQSWGSETLKMPYYWYTDGSNPTNDRNMSSLMFTTGDWFIPTLAVEATQTNPVSFDYEFHNMMVHAKLPVSVKKGPANILETLNAYPNPANNEVNITFGSTKTDAYVTITNALGQVVASQKVVKGNSFNKVTFSTANLASGTYQYSVEADGYTSHKRLVVTH
jgi:hypothetical protein